MVIIDKKMWSAYGNYELSRILGAISIVLILFAMIAVKTALADIQCEAKIAISKTTDTTNIYLINMDTKDEVRLTNSANDIYLLAAYPNWSIDGKSIVFQGQVNEPKGGSYYNWDIFSINTDGSNLVRLTSMTSNETHPKFSPDGSKIAFVTDKDGNPEIYVMNISGTDMQNVTHSKADDGGRGFDWSPDGKGIVFVSNRDKGQIKENEKFIEDQIYLIDISSKTDASNSQRLINLTEGTNICPAGEDYSNPTWSHDGKTLAFAASCGDLSDIYRMTVTQSVDVNSDWPILNLTQGDGIPNSNDGFLGFTWSSDDKQIAYVSSPEGQGGYGGEIYEINIGENPSQISNPSQLTHYNSSTVFIASPAWQPCTNSGKSS